MKNQTPVSCVTTRSQYLNGSRFQSTLLNFSRARTSISWRLCSTSPLMTVRFYLPLASWIITTARWILTETSTSCRSTVARSKKRGEELSWWLILRTIWQGIFSSNLARVRCLKTPSFTRTSTIHTKYLVLRSRLRRSTWRPCCVSKLHRLIRVWFLRKKTPRFSRQPPSSSQSSWMKSTCSSQSEINMRVRSLTKRS